MQGLFIAISESPIRGFIARDYRVRLGAPYGVVFGSAPCLKLYVDSDISAWQARMDARHGGEDGA